MGTRREFLKKASLGAGSLALGAGSLTSLSARSFSRIQGANDRINVAFIGCGGRVGAYYSGLAERFNTRLTHLCDVKLSQAERSARALSNRIDYTAEITDDLRVIIDDADVDAVFIATPDHWHAPGAIMAMQAGKHVYVEKPCSHNPYENELIVTAQQRYDRVVQMGNQTRSAGHVIEIVNEIHNGVIGTPYRAVAFYTNNRGPVDHQQEEAKPDDLNWDLFLGPVPRESYKTNTWNYDWHWHGWKYGTAEAGNNATHELDMARWALQVDHPSHVSVEAAKRHFPDDAWTMYDSMYATFTYGNDTVIAWDGQSRNGYSTYGSGRGTIIYGTEGSVYMDRGVYRLYDRAGDLVREQTSQGVEAGNQLGGGGDMTTSHVANFLGNIRGTEEMQNAPIHDAAISCQMIHLANIAYRTGKALEVDSSSGRVFDRDAMALWKREYEPGWEPTV